jgi:hypothetical protein
MEKNFLSYYWKSFSAPQSTFKRLAEDPAKLRMSFLAVLITAVLYTFVYIFLIFGGGQPFKPWLDIPLETYYRYNVFFCAPSMFLGWVLSAAVVHLFARTNNGTGNFESLLASFGFGISLASWTTGLHDVITSFLGAVKVISQRDYELALNAPTIWRTLLWIQMLAYLFAFVYLFSVGVKAVYGCGWGKSVLLGCLGFLLYQGFFLIFNR